MIIIKSGNTLKVRKQNVCTYKEAVYIIMGNVKVMIIVNPSSEVLDNS
jgi:hypothetical protein